MVRVELDLQRGWGGKVAHGREDIAPRGNCDLLEETINQVKSHSFASFCDFLLLRAQRILSSKEVHKGNFEILLIDLFWK